MNQVVDYYNQIADIYDKDRFANSYGRFIDQQERRVLDGLSIDSSRAVDLPCGTGRLTNYADMGCDASIGMLEVAKRNFPDKKFMEVDATCTPFADGEKKTVLSFHLLMHLDKETIVKVLNEMYRILEPGGRWICDIPSAKRRNLTIREQGEWHGNTSLSIEEMKGMCEGKFRINSVHGIMLSPVHRLPKAIRNGMCSIDYMLANHTFLREYSSYMIFELCKI